MPTELKPNKDLQGCIESQPVFFATAGIKGKVNVSPKGLKTLFIENDSRILWLCSAQLSNARSPDQRWVLLPTALHHTDSLTLILQVIFARVMAV